MSASEIRRVTGMIQELEGLMREENALDVETQNASDDLFRATNALFFTVSMSQRGYIMNVPPVQPPLLMNVPPVQPPLPIMLTGGQPLGQSIPQKSAPQTTTTCLCPNCGYNITIALS